MDWEKILASLAGTEGSEAMVEFVKAQIAKATKDAKELGKLTKGQTAQQAAMDALKGNLSKVLEHLGIEVPESGELDLDDALAGLASKGKGKPGDKTNPDLEELQRKVLTLTKNIDKLQNQLGEKDKLAGAERAKRHEVLKTNAVMKALVENKAIKPAELAKIIGSNVKVNEDDSLWYIGNDGEEIEIGAGVKGWLDANPEFVQSVGAPGGGGHGGKGGKGDLTDADKGRAVAEARNKGAADSEVQGLNPWATK